LVHQLPTLGLGSGRLVHQLPSYTAVDTSLSVGGSAPARVHVSADTSAAKRSASPSSASSRSSSACRCSRRWDTSQASSPLVKASPAPIVSTTLGIAWAGAVTLAEPLAARLPPAVRDHHQGRTQTLPPVHHSLSRLPRVDPPRVDVAHLDQAGTRDQAFQQRAVDVTVGEERGADVRVDRDQALIGLPFQERAQRRRARLQGEREGSEMERLDTRQGGGQVLDAEQTVGAALGIEGVGLAAADRVDEGQRGQLGSSHKERGVDPVPLQVTDQGLTEGVGRDAAQEGGRHAQTAQAHRHVQRRAPGARPEVLSGRRHVDQCFAAHRDHVRDRIAR
jgi:hypothetical protein